MQIFGLYSSFSSSGKWSLDLIKFLWVSLTNFIFLLKDFFFKIVSLEDSILKFSDFSVFSAEALREAKFKKREIVIKSD